MIGAGGRGGLTGVSAPAGAGVQALAGEVRVSIQNDVPADSSQGKFDEMQARVAMLELSLEQLRSALAQPNRRQPGIGHNQGPEFSPVPIADLDDIDKLIALLKESGPAPPPDPAPLIEQNAKVAALGDRINHGLIDLGKEIAKGAAREMGKELLASHWAAVYGWIKAAGGALLTWLGLQ